MFVHHLAHAGGELFSDSFSHCFSAFSMVCRGWRVEEDISLTLCKPFWLSPCSRQRRCFRTFICWPLVNSLSESARRRSKGCALSGWVHAQTVTGSEGRSLFREHIRTNADVPVVQESGGMDQSIAIAICHNALEFGDPSLMTKSDILAMGQEPISLQAAIWQLTCHEQVHVESLP